MNLLIKAPTRGRPADVLKLVTSLRQCMEDQERTYIVVTHDVDDRETRAIQNQLREAGALFNANPHPGKIHAINFGLQDLLWDVVMIAPDDWETAQGFDATIFRDMAREFPDLDGVIYYDDGIQGKKLATHPVMGRTYFERFGFYMNPAYLGLYSDNEAHEVAEKLGRLRYMGGSIGRHAHHSITGKPKDALNLRDDRLEGTDRRIWESRKAAGYPFVTAGKRWLP